MTAWRPTVAVIGAGFSGTIVATHLLRSSATHPVRVLLIDRTGQVGRGVAYGTTSDAHLLNVPAGRMSAFVGDEDHFLRFAQARDARVTGGSFVSRQLYGSYLAATLDDAVATAAQHGSSLERIHAQVTDIEMPTDAARAALLFADGTRTEVDRIVLAAGNFSPSDPWVAKGRELYASGHYIRDPWAPGALDAVRDDAPVLLLGTGLTMLDLAVQLEERGRSAPMYALSRRGLVPLPHRPHGAPPSYGHLPPELIACEASAASYLRAIRRHARDLASAGIDWREVVASLRPVTPRLWETLSAKERERFLRHARPYWDTHRHRVAPELYAQFEAMQASGALTLRAGRVLSFSQRDGGVDVAVRSRGSHDVYSLQVGMVINCTGPESDVRRVGDPLIDALLQRSVLRTDVLGLGLDTSHDRRLLDADGRAHDHLWLVGPLLKGRFWEATAVPELRGHAAHVARSVLGSLHAEA